MRKVIYAMSVSLDGFIEATNGDLRWSYPNEELHKHFNDQETMIDIHLVHTNYSGERQADVSPVARQDQLTAR